MKKVTRDALRLGLQSAVAAAAFFIVHRSLGWSEAFVGVLSAVLIVQPSVGSTINAGLNRFLATLLGSSIGVICLLILPQGYGTAAALAVCMFAVNTVAGFKPDWRYGVVAAVAISMGGEGDAAQIAIDRSIAIGLGVAIGLITSLTIWPDSAKKRTTRHLRTALGAIANRVDHVILQLTKTDAKAPSDGQDAYHRAISDAQDALGGIRGDDKSRYSEACGLIQHLYTSIILLKRAAEDGGIADTTKRQYADQMSEIRGAIKNALDDLLDDEVAADACLEKLKECQQQLVSADKETFSYDDMQSQIVDFSLRQILQDLEALQGTNVFS